MIGPKGNLEIPLPPFRREVKLPKNKAAVYFRTKNTLKRIAKDPEISEKCIETMGKYLAAGHVEEVTFCEENDPRSPTTSQCFP